VPDVSSPLKAYLRKLDTGAEHSSTELLLLEKRIEKALHVRYGVVLSDADRAAIKLVDKRLVMTEARDLLPPRDDDDCWFPDVELYPWRIEPLDPWTVEDTWLYRFRQLRSSGIHIW
jgi:hypothetical protein